MQDVVLIYTTWPDAETADAAAVEAVERRLAACANRLAPIRSTYRWEGRVEQADETPVLFKTAASTAPNPVRSSTVSGPSRAAQAGKCAISSRRTAIRASSSTAWRWP